MLSLLSGPRLRIWSLVTRASYSFVLVLVYCHLGHFEWLITNCNWLIRSALSLSMLLLEVPSSPFNMSKKKFSGHLCIFVSGGHNKLFLSLKTRNERFGYYLNRFTEVFLVSRVISQLIDKALIRSKASTPSTVLLLKFCERGKLHFRAFSKYFTKFVFCALFEIKRPKSYEQVLAVVLLEHWNQKKFEENCLLFNEFIS